jgi:hypothetical protein
MSTTQNAINPNHPADVAMLREHGQGPQRPVIPVSGQDVAELARLSPIDRAIRRFGADAAEVPKDSPAWNMSQSEIKTAMDAALRAAQDLRSAQDQTSHLEEIARSNGPLPDSRNVLGIPMIQTDGTTRLVGGQVQNAERLNALSAHSAAQAGMSQAEYDAAMQQLANDLNPSDPTRTMRERFDEEQRNRDLQSIASTNPNAPSPESNEATLNDLCNGQFALAYPTGEVFRGSLQEIQSAVIKAGIETKKWGRSLNAEVKQLRAQLAALQNGQNPGAVIPETPQPTWEQLGQLPDESSRFLVENAAKVLGYRNADELINHQLERDQKLASVEQKLEQYENDKILGDSMLMAPDYPDTKQAANAIAQIIDASGLEWNADNMALAYQHAVRKGLYQALRPEEIEASNQPQQRSSRHVPPTPPTGNAPGGNENLNPWSMDRDELRKKVLEGGGLGRALMNLRPGQTLGEE